jgi:hypothetical protein
MSKAPRDIDKHTAAQPADDRAEAIARRVAKLLRDLDIAQWRIVRLEVLLRPPA